MTPRRRLLVAVPILLLLASGAVLFWQVRTAALPFVNYEAQYKALVTPAVTEGPNGYDFLIEATVLGARIDQQVKPPEATDHDWHLWYPFEIRRSPDGRELAVHPELAPLLELTADPELLRLLDELAAATWAAPPMPSSGAIMALEPWMELSIARNIAHWEATRLGVAHAAGDFDAAVRSLGRCLALARAVESRIALISRLHGFSIRALALQALRHSLAHQPAPEAVLIRYLAEIDRAAPPDIRETVEAERLMMLDAIQCIYHGHTGTQGPGQADIEALRPLMASHGASVGETERLFGMLRSVLSTHSVRDRAAGADAVHAAIDGLSGRYLVISMLMPSWAGVLRNDAMFLTELNGARLMLAIEIHRSRHGSPPSSLDDLVPDLLPALPADHFAPDRRFGYRVLTDADADPDARAYLLYSLGFDGIDNGGVMPDPGEMSESGRRQALPFADPGYDWVANHGFERQAKADADADE